MFTKSIKNLLTVSSVLIAVMIISFSISIVNAAEGGSGSLVPETSYALCHDGLDNDDNGSTDMADSACVGFATETATTTATSTATTTPSTPVSTGGSVGSSGSFYGGFGGGSVLGASTSTGSVLGASTDDATSTCVLFKTFIKKGKKNDKAEVKMLQKFLNSKIDAKLPVTGTFGTLTEKALKKFQLEYKDSILTPWVEAGLMKDATPTGYFFKTTQYSVNKMICPNATIEAPVLK